METLMLASYVLKTQKNYAEIDLDRIASAGNVGGPDGAIARLVGTVATIALFVVVLNLAA